MNLLLEVLQNGQHTEQYMAVAPVIWSNGRRDKNLTFVSVYFKYSLSSKVFITKRRRVLEERYDNIIIGVDTNDHSPLWHCDETNAKGRLVETETEFNLGVEQHDFVAGKSTLMAFDAVVTGPESSRVSGDRTLRRNPIYPSGVAFSRHVPPVMCGL